MSQLYRVDGRGFIAGFTVDGGIVSRAAPILRRHVLGKTFLEARNSCVARKWTVTEVRLQKMPGPFDLKRP